MPAQTNYVWAFGYNSGLDFNTDPPSLIFPTIRQSLHDYNLTPSSASVSNCSRNLLFYASNCQMWDRNYQPMPNGTLLGDCNYGLPGYDHIASTQVCIIPNTRDSLKYFVVSNVYYLPGYNTNNSYHGLYYSEVDMRLNNGLGDVDSIKNIRINKFNPSSCLTIVPHSNNLDYWLVTKPYFDSFFVYKVNSNGIDSIPIKSYGLGDNDFGEIKFSHDYKQIGTTYISSTQSNNSAIIYDFNRSNGIISNPKPLLRQNQCNGQMTRSIEFSANDSFIYISTPYWNLPLTSFNRIVQVERYATDITATMIVIKDNIYSICLQIGPDNKIYSINNSTTWEMIGVIHNPNKKGLGCNFVYNQYILPSGHHDAYLPKLYFPVYNLYFKTVSEPNNCYNDSARFINQSDTSYISYTWVFGDGDSLIVPDKRPVAHKYLNEGQYHVILRGISHNHSFCNTETFYGDTITVKYKPKVKISLDSLQIKCQKQILFVKDSTAGRIHSEWYWGDSSNIDTGYYSSHLFDTSGIYNIKLTSFNENCSDTDSIQVHININQMPMADFIISDSVECFNNNLFQLTNTSYGKGNLKYLWQFGDGDTSTLFDTLHSYHSADTFNVMLVCSSDSVCRDTAVKRVIVHASPNSSFSVSDSVQCFIDNFFTLFNKSTINQGSITFLWDFGNSVTSKVFETSIHYDSTGNYNVSLIATSGFGCTDTAIIQMQVKPEPISAFTINDSLQCLAGNKFNFTNKSKIQTDTFSNYWSFGDDTISTIASPNYIYMDTGNFKVTLITTSSFGCKDTISKKVVIFPDPSVLSVTGEDHCGPGMVNLIAIAENGIIKWFSSDIGGTLLYQGDTFFTNAGANYFAEAVNPGCSSTRTSVTSMVKYIPQITSTTPASNLQPASITLRAFPDYGIVNWYDTSVGGVLLANGTSFTTPFLDSSKTYYVDATYLDCTTLTRTGIKATIGPNSINDHFNEVQVIFYPNPVNDVLIIDVYNLTEKATLTFMDIQGGNVKTVNLNPVNSKITRLIDLHDLHQGMYLLNLRNDSICKTARLVKF